jgi:integrase
MSSQALYNLVIKYGKMIGRQLQPHDLRRTGAQIAWKAGVPIEQISLALGHESIETTSLYLGIERDWEKQPADFIPY